MEASSSYTNTILLGQGGIHYSQTTVEIKVAAVMQTVTAVTKNPLD
ncbi:hypothetical protein DSBG_1768 [Desulfosporosinus sp. BG]|nr:hypothetical protein DSBG_1768 [Desulfosporosinus sp. BG]